MSDDKKDVTNEIIKLTESTIKDMIYEIRGQRIMLDFHLAKIYGYETRSFNKQVKRNSHKFPNDFMFKLTREELNEIVMSQNVISPNENYFSGQGGESRKLPYAILNRVSILIDFLKGLCFNSL